MKSVKKFAFIGSHGVGKSSAALQFASLVKSHDRSQSVKLIEENVREIAHLFDNKINNPLFQKLCMVDHLQKEFSAECIYDIIVCDRTAIDTLVYGLVYGIQFPSEYFSLALNHLSSFECLYFIRPDLKNNLLINDGFRDTDPVMQLKVDEMFERILKLWGGEYVEIRASEALAYNYLPDLEGDEILEQSY